MKKTRSYSASGSALKPIAVGFLVIWGSFIILSLIISLILFNGDDPTERTSLFSLIAFIGAGAIGTLINKRLFKLASLNSPIISAVAAVIVYVVTSAIISGKIGIGCLINAVCFILISLLFSAKGNKKTRTAYRRK